MSSKLRRAPGVPGGRLGGRSGDRSGEGRPEGLPEDSAKPRRTSVIQKHRRKSCFPKTARGRRSARTAKDAGGARSCGPTPATPSGLAAARPTPPPRARPPQPRRPRLAGGAARREGRARRPQAGAPIGRGGGGSARGRREEGKPVAAAAAAAERAEAAGFVTVAPPRWLAGCEAWVRRAAPRGAARSGGRLGAGGLEAQVHVKISWQLSVETVDHLALISTLFRVSKRACPNEQDSTAEQYSWNKCYSYSGSCQRLTAGSSAGACRPWGRGQSRASEQAKQKELSHGSKQ